MAQSINRTRTAAPPKKHLDNDNKIIENRSLLAGQIIFVTGGSRGLGKSIALALARQGAAISLTYLKEKEGAVNAVNEIKEQGGSAILHQVDVTDFSSVQRAIEGTKEYFGGLTGLVNNAGLIRDKALMLMNEDDWRDVIETNLTGVFNASRASIVTFMKQKYGRIINIASIAGMGGTARQVNYSASKAGVVGFTKALAKEVASYGVTVNAVAPGYIATGMAAALDEKQQEKAKAGIPIGRFGRPEEVAGTVVFLFSDPAAYITGQVLIVDGGASL